MKTSRRSSFAVLAVAFLSIAAAYPSRLSAETPVRWSVQVRRVNAGATSIAPSFEAAIYENLIQELTKSKRFKDVLRDGDYKAGHAADLLILQTTVEKYTPGSETLRAATTVAGWTKLRVRAHLSTRDDNVVLDRTVSGNVRFFGSNLRATHNLARNIAKAVKKSPLPQPPSSATNTARNSTSSDEIVVVEFR